MSAKEIFNPQGEPDEETLEEIESFLKLPLEDKTPSGYGVKDDCKHMKVYLDAQNHTIECQDCKKILDPFWYLQLLAKEWSYRRYQDAEAIAAYRKLNEKERNACARTRGKAYIRPNEGNGMLCWDSYEDLYGHQPEYVFCSGGYWYAGEDGGSEIFQLIQSQLADRNNSYKLSRDEFLKQAINEAVPKYQAEYIYAHAFKAGREYEAKSTKRGEMPEEGKQWKLKK